MPLIFLVGPRACGKTTIGRLLAQRLALPFIDTDHYLLEQAGRTVAEIVEAEGWPGFRKRESDALRAVTAIHPQGAVIATGGGMVLDEQNRIFMREQGHVFYLSVPVEALAARLSGGSNFRIIVRHIIPNVLPIIVVYASLVIPGLILLEATLSYLGLGVRVPTPSWGNMLQDSKQFFRSNWTLVFIPGFMIYITVLSIYLVGSGMRDAIDPRLGDK